MNVRIGAILLVGFLAPEAWAKPPSPGNSNVPRWIMVVGTGNVSGTCLPDASGAFTATVRDFTNAPEVGVDVEVDFQSCSDVKLCQAVVAGERVDCANNSFRAQTNAMGQVTMTILGAGTNSGQFVPPAIAPGAGSGCVRISCEGVVLGFATAVVYDQNGALPGSGNNGVNGSDLAIAKNDVGASTLGAPYRGRSDYDQDGTLNGADLGFLRDVIGRSSLGGGSAMGCASSSGLASYCL